MRLLNTIVNVLETIMMQPMKRCQNNLLLLIGLLELFLLYVINSEIQQRKSLIAASSCPPSIYCHCDCQYLPYQFHSISPFNHVAHKTKRYSVTNS